VDCRRYVKRCTRHEYLDFRRYRACFLLWVAGFLAKINDLHLEVLEPFQNADGSRVASRWLLTGRNNGFAGTAPDRQDIKMTGTAVWAVREDGKLLSNHVERAALEQLQRLTTPMS